MRRSNTSEIQQITDHGSTAAQKGSFLHPAPVCSLKSCFGLRFFPLLDPGGFLAKAFE